MISFDLVIWRVWHEVIGGRRASVPQVRAALIQFESDEDPSSTRRSLRKTIDQVKGEVDLIVLPEASARRFGDASVMLAPDAESLEGPFVSELVAIAAAREAVVIAGMFERSNDPMRPYNTTVAASAAGMVGVYRKIHLYDARGFEESKGVTPGSPSTENVLVLDVGDLRVGVMTCFDLRFPEMGRRLIDHGAEVIVLGAAWVPGIDKVSQFKTLTEARAIESTTYVLAACQPAPRYCGHTRAVDPNGRCFADAGAEGASVLEVELSKTLVTSTRETMPVVAQRKLGIAEHR